MTAEGVRTGIELFIAMGALALLPALVGWAIYEHGQANRHNRGGKGSAQQCKGEDEMSGYEHTAKEALEIAEEEIAFAKDTGQRFATVDIPKIYKRQRYLASAVLEQREALYRLRSDKRELKRLYFNEVARAAEVSSEATRGNN